MIPTWQENWAMRLSLVSKTPESLRAGNISLPKSKRLTDLLRPSLGPMQSHRISMIRHFMNYIFGKPWYLGCIVDIC